MSVTPKVVQDQATLPLADAPTGPKGHIVDYLMPLASNSTSAAEIDATVDVLRAGRLTQGNQVRAFEKALEDYHGVKHAIFVNSGSSANLIAIEALIYLSRLLPDLTEGHRLGPGDEGVIQGLSWPSTLKPLSNHGLVPVFCDIDPQSLNATPEDVEAVRSERTRMVIAVPVLGNPSGLDELADYCAAEGLLLVVDGCESLGAVTPRGSRVGSLGLATAFSFYFSHHITTIEGGAVLTDDDHLADVARSLREHGWTRSLKVPGFLDSESGATDPRFRFVLPGYNVRSTEVNATLGLGQMGRLEALVHTRQERATSRIAALQDLSQYVSVPGADVARGHSWMTFPMIFPDRPARDRAQDRLESSGIETRPIITGNVLRQPLASMLQLTKRQPELPVCDLVFDTGLMVGLDPDLPAETETRVQGLLHDAISP